jgi:hypothetical protein
MQRRHLTFFGKLTVIKSLIIPKFIYLLQSISISEKHIKKINAMVYNFLWDGKQEKIRRNTLSGNKLKGGIQIPDIEITSKTLKVKWIKSLISEENANWKIIPKYFLNQYGKNLLILK